MAGPSSRVRLVGLDVARCVALLGMVATHVLDERDPDGTLTLGQWLAGGRASALFAVLAGVTLALSTGGRTPVAGRERAARTVGIVVRALLVAVLGLALALADSGLAVILTYYGLLFCVGAVFVGLRTRALLVLAAAWVVVVPVLSHAVRPHLPERGYDSPAFDQLAEPGQLASELLLTGYYPVLPWVAYLLVGMALGRADLGSRRVQATLAGSGLALAVVATQVSHALTDRWPAIPGLPDEVATGTGGTTPADGPWSWLLVVAPHSATPFDLVQTIGSALLVIGGCLLLVGALPAVPREAVRVFFGAGTMTLTLYSLHVLLRTERLWPPEEPSAYVWHVLVLLGIGSAYAALRRPGPLERAVSAASRETAALVPR
ncbi:heparan-alpha-glucosaminide N-acetyltransferase domain-containing protein [Nocardioides dongkuii]|uniref:heparan-alpha-glucosaminide N-acetyltransferase domain-containing protein n=1 Tax=Nocardioides dongkuii TaxID=2760089 RepID=UPI0015FABAE5|nr:heparan-alpha-glucosaminide N-acetyltransferase domain-containing protein [Nocardioides dongkuii]